MLKSKIPLPTIERMINMVATQYPHYKNSSVKDRIALAKLYVRKHLCQSCKTNIIDKDINDFYNLGICVCPNCENTICGSIYKAQRHKVSYYIYQINKEIRQRLLDEIFNKTGENAYDLILHLHKKELLSAPAIKEYLYSNYQIAIGVRHLTLTMRDWGILDTHIEAVRKRVYTGRMNYRKRKIDYKNRVIDYAKREQRNRAGIEAEHKFIMIKCDKKLKSRLKAYSRRFKRTMSQTVRILFYSLKGRQVPSNCKSYCDKLWYAINYGGKGYLYIRGLDSLRGKPIILRTYN